MIIKKHMVHIIIFIIMIFAKHVIIYLIIGLGEAMKKIEEKVKDLMNFIYKGLPRCKKENFDKYYNKYLIYQTR